MEDTVVRCPRCAAVVAFGEKFCAACGTAVIGRAAAVPVIDDPILEPAGAVSQDPVPVAVPRIDLDATRKLGNARKWLVAMSVIQVFAGLVFYAINSSKLDGLEGAGGDAARGRLHLALAIQFGLAGAFFALWLWAKRNVLAACVTALLLFVTVVVLDTALEPSEAYRGIVMKVLFVVALGKAISVAQQERKLAA